MAEAGVPPPSGPRPRGFADEAGEADGADVTGGTVASPNTVKLSDMRVVCRDASCGMGEAGV